MSQQCDFCSQPAISVCVACKEAWYCSETCQKQDWIGRHWDRCLSRKIDGPTGEWTVALRPVSGVKYRHPPTDGTMRISITNPAISQTGAIEDLFDPNRRALLGEMVLPLLCPTPYTRGVFGSGYLYELWRDGEVIFPLPRRTKQGYTLRGDMLNISANVFKILPEKSRITADPEEIARQKRDFRLLATNKVTCVDVERKQRVIKETEYRRRGYNSVNFGINAHITLNEVCFMSTPPPSVEYEFVDVESRVRTRVDIRHRCEQHAEGRFKMEVVRVRMWVPRLVAE